MKQASDSPTWFAARPTPGAAYIVSNMSSAKRRSVASNRPTGFVCSRRTGSPSVRIGFTVTRRSSEVGLGLDPCHDPLLREPAHRATERRDLSATERDQAYRLVSDARGQKRAMSEGRELGCQLGRPDDPEDQRPDREPRLRPARELGASEPVGATAHERLDSRIVRMLRLHDDAAVRIRPPGGLEPGGERTLSRGEPGPAGGKVRVQDADEIESLRTELIHGLDAANEHLRLAGCSREPARLDPADGDGRDAARPLLHPFRATTSDTEVLTPAARAPAERPADGATHVTLLHAERSAAGPTGGGLA